METIISEAFEQGCTICGDTAGPFVVTDLQQLTAHTPAGPQAIQTRVGFCAPSERREGCAGQLARAIGYASEAEQEHLRELAREALAKAETEEQRAAEFERKQLKVVPVSDLLELIGDKGAIV